MEEHKEQEEWIIGFHQEMGGDVEGNSGKEEWYAMNSRELGTVDGWDVQNWH